MPVVTLTRRIGERVCIRWPSPTGEVTVWVTMRDILSLGKARLAIDAPREVVILREELMQGRQPDH